MWRLGILNLLLFPETRWSRIWKMASHTPPQYAEEKREKTGGRSQPRFAKGEDSRGQIYQLSNLKLKRSIKYMFLTRRWFVWAKERIKRKERSTPLLTWISPGCVWRFVRALSWDHKQLFLNISWVPERKVSRNPPGGNTFASQQAADPHERSRKVTASSGKTTADESDLLYRPKNVEKRLHTGGVTPDWETRRNKQRRCVMWGALVCVWVVRELCRPESNMIHWKNNALPHQLFTIPSKKHKNLQFSSH